MVFPMNPNQPSTPSLVEPSFAEAIAIISAAEELPLQTRRHWATSLRQVARMMDRPLELIPARYSAVRANLLQLHHAPVGLILKTLQNHKSNTKRALLWLAQEKDVPKHGAPMTPDWERLWAGIGDRSLRQRLSSLVRFCSACGIAPGEVDQAVVGRFVDYRSRSAKPVGDSFRRLLARAWNRCVGEVAGWPPARLIEPPIRSRAGPARHGRTFPRRFVTMSTAIWPASARFAAAAPVNASDRSRKRRSGSAGPSSPRRRAWP